MTATPSKTDKDLTVFARTFFRERVASFRKDVAICLTADGNRHHAYFPGLITCIGFVDLLSGLHAGRLEGHGLQELKLYASRFLNATNYSSLNLEVLYLAFRHKLAHLSFPYVVFDITNRKEYTGPSLPLSMVLQVIRRSQMGVIHGGAASAPCPRARNQRRAPLPGARSE
jgi:hypothetical protein